MEALGALLLLAILAIPYGLGIALVIALIRFLNRR